MQTVVVPKHETNREIMLEAMEQSGRPRELVLEAMKQKGFSLSSSFQAFLLFLFLFRFVPGFGGVVNREYHKPFFCC